MPPKAAAQALGIAAQQQIEVRVLPGTELGKIYDDHAALPPQQVVGAVIAVLERWDRWEVRQALVGTRAAMYQMPAKPSSTHPTWPTSTGIRPRLKLTAMAMLK